MRRGSRSSAVEEGEADRLRRLDQERPVPAITDRGTAWASEGVPRVQLDPARGACRADDGERALTPVREGNRKRLAARPANAFGEGIRCLEGVERAAQLVGRANDARRRHKPSTARSKSSNEPSTRSASTSRTPSEGTPITYMPAARAAAIPGSESSNATASAASTPSASHAAR